MLIDGKLDIAIELEIVVIELKAGGELAELIREKLGGKVKIEFRDLPSDDPTQRQPDISKAKKVLGWEPKVKLAEGLDKTIAYFDAKLKES